MGSQFLNNKKYYLFLDEIQEVDGFEKVINFINLKYDVDIYITGSNSKILSGELATHLTGRYFSLELYPLSFFEIINHLEVVGVQPDLDREFVDYIKYGGLPAIQRFRKKEDLIKGYSENRSLSRETLYNYLDACKNAYLIYTASHYDIKGKQVLKTREKYFTNDLGIRGLFYNNEADIGQVLENIIYLQLLRLGYQVYVGEFGNQEVDFIAEKGNEKVYIQVAYLLANDETINRVFSALTKIQDNYPKYVISMDKLKIEHEGIKHLNIIDFLLHAA